MTGVDSNTNLLSSYYINDSFAGILRLSPNDSATLLDKNSGIEYVDEISSYINFEDSVTDYISTQFVSVSSSDGVLFDMGISRDAIEFENLYVLGTPKIPAIINYTNSDSEFYLGDIKMPNKYNAKSSASSTITALYNTPTEETIDETYILVNVADDNKTSNFLFERVTSAIGEIIEEELTKLSSLPAGSIHWIPVNIEQYKALLEKSDNDKHNSNSLTCDPIIRDFLICDGSRYKNTDFPELAKILYRETINRWVTDKSGENMERESITNNYNDEKTFVVPDLRSMFIEYIIPLEKQLGNQNDRTRVRRL